MRFAISNGCFFRAFAAFRRASLLPIAAAVFFLAIPSVFAADRAKFDELVGAVAKGEAAEADVFAPKAWAKTQEKLAVARRFLEEKRKQKDLDEAVAEAREFADNALKAAEVGKLSLQQYLDPRARARVAKAPTLVVGAYQLAETVFLEATRKIESGDVKGGLRKAAEATPLFDKAEDAAIRVDVLGAADGLIAGAEADESPKYALSTLDAARAARTRAAGILTKDRYNRTEAVREAARAEYEARHASNIAKSVRSLNRNDQAWEKLMLLYEIQMNRIGEKMGLEYLPFDNGPIAATDSVVAFISDLESAAARARDERASTSAQLTGQMSQLRGSVTQQLQQVLARLSSTTSETDPLKLAEAIDQRVAALLEERTSISERAKATDLKLSELTAQHKETSAELGSRVESEERFDQVKKTLNPSEGEILLNATGDVVLRLRGLSFAVGKSEVTDEHAALLQKVAGILKLYPEATYVVEGHTDTSGEGAANQQLSERRAFAVMQSLRQSLSISADRMKAIGYGSEKPIASNQGAEGRARTAGSTF